MFLYKNETYKISINNKTGDRIIPPVIAHILILQSITLNLLSIQTSQDGVFQKLDVWGPDLCMIGFGKILNRKPTIIEYGFIAKLFQSKMRLIMGHNLG